MMETAYWIGWAIVLTGGAALAMCAVTWLVTAPFYWSFKRMRASWLFVSFLQARHRQRKHDDGEREFLRARNVHDEVGPPLGAIVFQMDQASADHVVTLNIQGDTWETRLTFTRGDGAMWIVP